MSVQDPAFYLAHSRKTRLPSVIDINPKLPTTGPQRPGRHDAITGKVGDWKDYKRWAEIVRSTWEEDSKKGD